ncbi:hypothetical protein I6N96_10935 [Enterococcus sp. BWM-S5]|uniref:Uncharacterized protein n=1 Tax=Enterococcus larvae TaxID=2794352 RepID=A0ABS4CKX2_9ENTE|nr:hypothetical protein [Enterococcus larvae]MBP1046781.1 hypothetical protein [Enterococcus larvae]
MGNSGFDNLKNDSWLFTSVVYSYISFFISLIYFLEIPVLCLVIQLITIGILLYSKYKSREKFRLPIYASLGLNILLAVLALLVGLK